MTAWQSALAIAFSIVLVPTQTVLAFESSKLSPGAVVEGSGLQSPKFSPGVVIEGSGLQSSKLSAGIVVVNVGAFKSSKLSAGVVVETLNSSGGVVPRAPLTHW